MIDTGGCASINRNASHGRRKMTTGVRSNVWPQSMRQGRENTGAGATQPSTPAACRRLDLLDTECDISSSKEECLSDMNCPSPVRGEERILVDLMAESDEDYIQDLTRYSTAPGVFSMIALRFCTIILM
jgi:hypothetical protein